MEESFRGGGIFLEAWALSWLGGRESRDVPGRGNCGPESVARARNIWPLQWGAQEGEEEEEGRGAGCALVARLRPWLFSCRWLGLLQGLSGLGLWPAL